METKQQLIDEVRDLHRRVAELEGLKDALRESEAKYRVLVEQSLQGIIIVQDSRLAFVNPAAVEVAGYTVEELVGFSLEEVRALIYPEDRDLVWQRLQARLAGKPAPPHYEFRMIRKDGVVRWVELLSSRIEYRGKAAVQAVFKDITERKQAELALQQRSQELALLNRAARAFSSTLNLDRVLAAVLEEMRRLLHIVASSVWLVDPETGELVCRQATSPQGEVVRGWRLAPGQGLAGWVARSGESLNVPDVRVEERHFKGVDERTGLKLRSILTVPLQVKQEVIGVLQTVDEKVDRFDASDRALLESLAASAAVAIENARLYDRLQRHAAELEQRVAERTAELREQQARIQAILDAAGEGIVVTNLEGAIVYLNPAASRLTGYSLAEASLNTPAIWSSGQHPSEFFEQMQQIIRLGQVWHGEMVNCRKDGSLFDAAWTIAPIPDEQGRPIGFVGILNDVTRLKELDRLKSKFVADVSHELGTPVTNLILYSNLLEQPDDEKRAHYLTVLQAQAQRLSTLVKDILSLSRLEADKEGVVFEPVDLNLVVERVVAGHRPQAEAAGLELAFAGEENLPPVRANDGQLAQVVTNLVANALNYTPAGRVQVTTRLDEERGQVSLQVEDTGMGIAPEDLPYVFDRFYRGQRVSQSEIPGTGLGLAIVKEIVDLHEGSIEVESEVGEGSTFRVWWPFEGGER
jgi:two-component system phosphate regulon sensor histidine kinase PhoR